MLNILLYAIAVIVIVLVICSFFAFILSGQISREEEAGDSPL